MRLTDFVVKEAILPNIIAETKESAVRQMVASLRKAGKIREADEDPIVSAIMKREELGSTGIGRGVAVPHTKHPSAESIIATVAICHVGLDFESLDGEDVFILFLLISPPDRPGDHLRGLETITRHLKNDNFCSFLKQSSETKQIFDLLREADDNEV